jgi:hypothetical protein
METFPFKGGRLLIRYSRAYGYELFLWLETPPAGMNVPHPEDGIIVGLIGLVTAGGFEERGGFTSYEQALEAGIEMIEDFSEEGENV